MKKTSSMQHFKSLRNKFVRTMLLATGIIGMATLAIVVTTSMQASSAQLSLVQGYIEEGITSKGRVLTQNHALALRGMTLDNAFLDMQRLVERAVGDDSDLVYGLYVNSERETLAYSRRDLPAPDDQVPNREAWKELGIPERDVLVSAEAVTHTLRFGQALVEIAVPVIGERAEVVGTIRYGLSTRRMHEAQIRAQADAQSRLWRSLLWSAALIGTATIFGLILSRFQAVRITRPLAALTTAAEVLARGDRAVRVHIESGDELERLGSSFNQMVEDLDSSYQELEAMNRTLEQKVAARTVELAHMNRDMRLVLDNVDRGFVTVSADGTMARERSRVVEQWFGEGGESDAFSDYAGKYSPSFGIQFKLAWEQVTAGLLPLEVCLAQLPERLSRAERSFSVRYLPFFRDAKLEGVLLVIAEISERLAKERAEVEQAELMQSFRQILLDRAGFQSFLRESSKMVAAIGSRKLASEPLVFKGTLHTLKGNCGSMGLTRIAELCHTLEEEYAEHDAPSASTLSALAARWSVLLDQIGSFSETSERRSIEISDAEYARVLERLREDGKDQRELLQQVLSWQFEPVARSFRRLGEQGKTLARKLGRGDIEVEIDAGAIRLDPEIWTPFFSELTHVIRNAVDHGLETPDERVAQAKPLRGKLSLRARVSGGALSFELADDGRGIDWEAIAKKAEERGLRHQTPADLLNALCEDGLSTRDQVTRDSGRGIGMAGVKRLVEGMHGRLEVSSTRGVGTTWIVLFAWPPTEVPALKPRRAPSLAVPTV
jgi:HAMP domain-containing protein/HPt (histidine-containing phosphotransfer) domain-containing protein